MGGNVDRGGGREGKGKSLRNNKKEIADKVKALQKGHLSGSDGPCTSAPPPPIRGSEQAACIVDCGVQLLNRQFDRDQLKVLQRAASSGVQAMIAWTSDFEKVEPLVRLAKENLGYVYYLVGIHSDMIKRSNDKLSQQRLDQLKEAALRPEALALLTGLDFSRDMGIRYAQERAMQQQMAMAVEIGLPLVLYQVSASDVLLDKVQEFREQYPAASSAPASAAGSLDVRAATGSKPLQQHSQHPVAVYSFCGSESDLARLIAHGCYIMVNGRAADPSETGQALRAALLAGCPVRRLLMCSDAPFATPQNIEDAFVREGRNEPSNLPYLVKALAATYGLQDDAMAAQLQANAFEFFSLQTEQQQQQHAASTAKVEQAASGSKGADASSCAAAAKQEQQPQEGSADDAAAAAESGGDDSDDEPAADTAGERQEGDGDQPAGRQQGQRRRPDVVPAKKPTARSFLPEGSEAARVTYACRGCRSILFSELDVRPHHAADADDGLRQVDFKPTRKGGKSGKGKSKGDAEAQLCSLYFLKSPLPWMQLAGAGAGPEEAGAAPGQAAQEGRLDCPCCDAKVGRFSLAGPGIACSCGAELACPAVGLLRARLDLVDGGLDLARAVQSTLQLYEDADDHFSSDSDDGAGRKKKKKQVKGRGNTSNFSSFRNKTFGQSAKPKKQSQAMGGVAEEAAGSGSDE